MEPVLTELTLDVVRVSLRHITMTVFTSEIVTIYILTVLWLLGIIDQTRLLVLIVATVTPELSLLIQLIDVVPLMTFEHAGEAEATFFLLPSLILASVAGVDLLGDVS